MKLVKRVVKNLGQHWVGDGFPVRSLFSYADGNQYDPFLLLDYAGPYEFGPAEATRGVGEHPHRGFETVTIVYQGELEHRDSSGSHGVIGPGDVQWMSASSGVVHEEYHSDRFTREGGTLEMVQLWVNLPAEIKRSPPRYQEILSSQIPTVELPNSTGSLRVIAGKYLDTAGAAKTYTPMNVWDIQIRKGASLTLEVPQGDTTLVIVQSGAIQLNQQDVQGVEMVEFEREGTELQMAAKSDCRVLLLAGTPLREPIYGQGPFVMNTREEIHQAIRDYQAGRMGTLPDR